MKRGWNGANTAYHGPNLQPEQTWKRQHFGAGKPVRMMHEYWSVSTCTIRVPRVSWRHHSVQSEILKRLSLLQAGLFGLVLHSYEKCKARTAR